MAYTRAGTSTSRGRGALIATSLVMEDERIGLAATVRLRSGPVLSVQLEESLCRPPLRGRHPQVPHLTRSHHDQQTLLRMGRRVLLRRLCRHQASSRKLAEPSSTASSTAPKSSSSTAKAIGSERPRSKPPNAPRPARAELPNPVLREDRVHEPPAPAALHRPSRPLRRSRREVDRLPPRNRAPDGEPLLRTALPLPQRNRRTTTRPLETPTHRSESPPAPRITASGQSGRTFRTCDSTTFDTVSLRGRWRSARA